MYNQREIILIPFPYSDLAGSKQRPALIISNERLNRTQDRICCLITTKARESDLPISKKDFEMGTLPFKSFVRLQRIFTIHEKIIKRKLCVVTKKFHDSVIEGVNDYLKRKDS